MSDQWIDHLKGLAKLEDNVGKKVAFETSAENIEQLQQENKALQAKNDALVARVARLEQAALIAIHTLSGGEAKAEVRDIYDETPAQSLQHIQAAIGSITPGRCV